MFRIQNLKLPYRHDDAMLRLEAARMLRIDPQEITAIEVLRRSLDCRAKPQIHAVYTVLVSCRNEKKVRSSLRKLKHVSEYQKTGYRMQVTGTKMLGRRPVIVGSGPAGLFCALELSRAGYAPVIAERGKPADERAADVFSFWNGTPLNPESNIQFGEGGAGTFSDGKLSTGVSDRDGRCRRVLEEFVRFGADPQILIDAHPHVGTDVLIRILKAMREEIAASGGTFFFSSRLDDISQGAGGRLRLHFSDGRCEETDVLVLAVGNGAQDTFRMLEARNVPIAQKAFSVGLRIEHPQSFIDRNAYGCEADRGLLPAASYKLTAHEAGYGIYSFCMCPGGYVVNASSVPGQLTINGMSYHDRGSGNANAALVLTVGSAQFGSDAPLAGLEYQKALERRAYRLCCGAVPQQRLEDFRHGRVSSAFGSVRSCLKGSGGFADLGTLFTPEMKDAFLSAMEAFDRRIPGFANPDAVLSGVESRTSSPVRILRNADGVSIRNQIYPCGEGAGYAGGICSAAMDGLKTAQQIAGIYKPFKDL